MEIPEKVATPLEALAGAAPTKLTVVLPEMVSTTSGVPVVTLFPSWSLMVAVTSPSGAALATVEAAATTTSAATP